MSTTNDGGPAFPGEVPILPGEAVGQGDKVWYRRKPVPGMSLRQWYIGQAIQGMCGELARNGQEPHYATVALRACAMADAAIEIESKGYPAPSWSVNRDLLAALEAFSLVHREGFNHSTAERLGLSETYEEGGVPALNKELWVRAHAAIAKANGGEA